MQKLVKISVLLFVILITNNTFAGGWQKYLPDYGIPYISYDNYQKSHTDNYLPTKDGGVLVYSSRSSFSSSFGHYDNFYYLQKFDKYGNVQWHKNIAGESMSRCTQIYYESFGGIYNVIELENKGFAIFHNGPKYFTGFCEFEPFDSSRFLLITIVDKFGNVNYTKFNANDTNYNQSNSAAYNFGSNTTSFYDKVNSEYVTYTLICDSVTACNFTMLQKKTYNSSFNLIGKNTITLPNSGYGRIEIIDSTMLISSMQLYDFILTDLSGQVKYQINTNHDTLSRYAVNSIQQLLTGCNVFYYYDDVRILDYYLDNNKHMHLFRLSYARVDSIIGPTTCNINRNGLIIFLVHFEFDLNGKVISTKSCEINITNPNNFSVYIPNTKIILLPQLNNILNILVLLQYDGYSSANDKPFLYYDFLKYDVSNSKVLSVKKVVNLGEANSAILANDNAEQVVHYFINKKKSLINNDYFCPLSARRKYESRMHWMGGNIRLLLKIDSLGNINNHLVSGNVFADQNNNCIKNATDRNLPQVTVTAQHQDYTAYTSTDNSGNYHIGIADSGTFTIKAEPNNTNYPFFAQGNCAQGSTYAYLDSVTYDTLNLALKPIIFCPLLYVDISTPLLRRCFSSIYTVNYKNNGSITSPNTYIDITLDRFLTVNSASKPYTNLGNNILRFQLGNIDYLTAGSFNIDVTVRCDSTVVGQTHCVEAHIYPDTVCAVANYTGPVISASVQCKIDSVEFKLKNTGGNMPQPKRYIVIEDNLNRTNGNFQLNNNQQQLITLKADSGKTYRIIAEQDDNFPTALGDKFATAFIERCNPLNNTFTTGFITQYPEYDGETYRSVDCQQNRGAYDPNDKTGYPIGVSSNHFIEKNTAIDYKINFQNTGTDTAFRVVIVDTISKFLDINTIEPGASSHSYIFMRTDSNTIKFIFDSINLVDSNKNEKLSHGFVKFRIQQKANNANGTKIYNQAGIYFDYNSPIFTNITTHTIGEIYVRILSATINPKYLQANIKVYPNPFRSNAMIDIQNVEQQKTTLILFDISGKEILQLQSNTNKYEINGNALENGMYLFKIQNDKEEIANGKLMVQ